MTGGADLDQYGTWRHDARYGDVWHPTDSPADWAPYRYGRWAWEPPWGWTWIDDAPWGFAPFHYGRWVYTAYGWEWVPGNYVDYPVYAPALVGYVGFGGPWVGWFPLAPFEVFVPSFFVSIDFVRRINITNVNITNINIIRTNGNVVVNNTTNVTINSFANRQFVTTVSTSSFTSGQSVSRTMVTQSTTTQITSTTPVSWAPGNVTAPHTAAASGWRGTDAPVRPPLPTANGGSAIAGKTTGGAGTASLGAETHHGEGSLPTSSDGGPVTQTATAGAANGHHGSPELTGTSVTSAGHKLPPLPSEPSHASTSTTVKTRTPSHPLSPQANSGRTTWTGSPPMVNGNRGRSSQPQTVTPFMHAPVNSFAPTRGPSMGSMMPRGPSMGATPRAVNPPRQSMGFMQHGGG